MKKDWTKRHKEHVILAKRRNKKMKKDWTKRHKKQTIQIREGKAKRIGFQTERDIKKKYKTMLTNRKNKTK